MTIRFTVDDVLFIHGKVRELFPNDITPGHINRIAISGILDNAFATMYNQPLHESVIEQAAVILEGIIRLHPFPDGNKRTALLTVLGFLMFNDHYVVIPLDVNRFMVRIAQNLSYNNDENANLINSIVKWITKRTATTPRGYKLRWIRYILIPETYISLLLRSRIRVSYARRKINYWLATDMRPEYKGILNTLTFIKGLNRIPDIYLAERSRYKQ